MTQVRLKGGSATHKPRWWQPTFRCLAPLKHPQVPGKGVRRKKMQQKIQQTMDMRARAKEGHRRNAILMHRKEGYANERVREVYRQYAEILRSKANEDRPGE